MKPGWTIETVWPSSVATPSPSTAAAVASAIVARSPTRKICPAIDEDVDSAMLRAPMTNENGYRRVQVMPPRAETTVKTPSCVRPGVPVHDSETTPGSESPVHVRTVEPSIASATE